MSKKSFLVVVILLIIIIGLMLGILLGIKGMMNSETEDENKGGVGLVVDPNAGEYVAPEVEEVPTQGVAIPGWSTITIPANTKDVTVDFTNPIANKDLYYLTFELRLIDNSKKGYEVLYKSGLVEPGLHIQKITLSKELAVGEYDAVVHVQPYRMNEEQTPTNNADMKTKLIVK
ncbi:MAG: hypothetical protein IJO08_04275 [Clostridia bacterium]|nr:hypothetical protein [Clostridia bacterium]